MNTRIRGAVLCAVLSLPVTSAFAHGDVDPSLVAAVRKDNSRFLDVAVAVKEGYSPISCASGADGGAMGIHYVNADLIKDDAIVLNRPEAVMYEPMPGGKLRLVAVEYITTKGPASLKGQLFNFTGTPNRYGLPAFYEMHVWAWEKNAKGAFADMNPAVSCEFAPSGG